MRIRALVAAWLVAATSQVSFSQSRDPGMAAGPAQAATGTGVIAGTVLAGDGSRPARRARLTLVGTAPSVNKSMTADDQGAFSFEALPAASYTLTATKGGLLDVIYGQKVPGSGRPGTAIQLAAGQRLDRVKLVMPRSGILTGTILDEFGDPAFGTSVRVTRYVFRGGVRTLVSAGTTSTDDCGMYRITGLLPGDYIVSVQSRDGLIEAQRARAEVEVRAMEAMMAVRTAGVAGGGEMRMALPETGPDPVDVYAVVYYPGSSPGSAATAITLGVGEEKPGIDLQLRRVPVASISGTVLSNDGQQSPETNVQLIDRGQLLPIHGIRSTTMRADGRFSISGVPPGQYTLTVFGVAGGAAAHAPVPVADLQRALMVGLTPADREQRLVQTRTTRLPTWATVDVTMSGRPVEGVVLTLQPGMTMSGSVVFEGGPPPVDLSRVTLRAGMADTNDATLAFEQPGAVPSPLDPSARFTIRGVVPGRYRMAASAVTGFVMKSAIFGGQDILDFPLEVKPGEDVAGGVVTFTTKSTELGGLLGDPTGAPMAEHTIVVFAADSRYWTPQSRRIQAARPATDGRFTFRGLPPGDYRLVAVTDVEPGQWLQPEFLRQIVAGSIPLTLGEGEKKTQDLRVTR